MIDKERWVQCTSICRTRSGAVFCTKNQGHDGDHRGLRAQWNDKERVKITEKIEL